MITETRWMINKDRELIEKFSPITKEQLKEKTLPYKNIGMVAELDGRVVGWTIFRFHRNTTKHILNFYVDKQYRRMGVGTCLMRRLMRNEKRITYTANETNVTGQLFLKSLGFKASKIIGGAYGMYDSYFMEWIP